MTGFGVTMTQSRDGQIRKRAKAGERLEDIARTFGLSKQRVSQIIRAQDPEWRAKRKGRGTRDSHRGIRFANGGDSKKCDVCGVKLGPHRSRFCSDEHREGMYLLKRLTVYYGGQRRKQAAWFVRNADRVHPSQVAWGRRVLAGEEPIRRRFVREDSKAYQRLVELGLEDRLPPEIVVRPATQA